jgi:hypothetical protein
MTKTAIFEKHLTKFKASQERKRALRRAKAGDGVIRSLESLSCWTGLG